MGMNPPPWSSDNTRRWHRLLELLHTGLCDFCVEQIELLRVFEPPGTSIASASAATSFAKARNSSSVLNGNPMFEKWLGIKRSGKVLHANR
jgi:hypothetical protein